MNIKLMISTTIMIFFVKSFAAPQELNLVEQCIKDLKPYHESNHHTKGTLSLEKVNDDLLVKACQSISLIEVCKSVKGRPIYHYERKSNQEHSKNILVFSLIHGDEGPAGAVGRLWMERLSSMQNPRNNWRVIPVLNPDGVVNKTRTNENKVDLNRNFPTRDWNEVALKHWKSEALSSPRRFPGSNSASEPEIKCALKHIDDFKPDFVVSVHTPLKVLDFDGPKISPPKFTYLPWKSLGHLPGSLGRYLWFERGTPVLTLELKNQLPPTFAPIEELQDLVGLLVTKYKISPLDIN